MSMSIVVPETWQAIPSDALRGVVMVVGAVDTGKSSLVRYLWQRVTQQKHPGDVPAVIDADIGQAVLGPPTTQTLRLAHPESFTDFPPRGRLARWFVGAISPRGHMLPTVVGLHRLVQQARRWGARTILVDTTGMVHPQVGGVALKWAEFDLLEPHTVIALQREGELEPLIGPWRHSQRFRLIELTTSPHVRPRSREERIAWRQYRFQVYFRHARDMVLDVQHLPRLGGGRLFPGRLLGFLDRRGFLVALGVLRGWEGHRWTVFTPLRDIARVDAIRLGSIGLDGQLRDHRPPPREEGGKVLGEPSRRE